MAGSDPIKFYDFREQYDIPAANARAIVDKLGFRIEKIEGDLYITGYNRYGKDNDYILKHAVLEFRRTMDIKRTLAGDFFEFTEEAEVKGNKVKMQYGVSNVDADKVRPIGASLKRKPNAQPDVDVAATSTEITPVAPSTPAAPEALTALVAALTQAQAAAAPKDPLLPQKQLLEAEQQGFRITTEQLSQLLGISKQTISSKKSGFIKLGFQFDKVKEGAATLWKVRKVD